MINSLRARKNHRRQRREALHRRRPFHVEALEDRRVLATWVPAGPSPILNGAVEKVDPDNEVSGAIHQVLAHPTDADILYIGATNGGVWKTENATDERPTWVPLTDDLRSISIGALEADLADFNHIVAGIGNYSSFTNIRSSAPEEVPLGTGGELTGLILTEDGGNSWQVLSDPLLQGENISGVAVRGDVILASANTGAFNFPTFTGGGLFRSIDAGATWTAVELLPRDVNNIDEATPFNVHSLVGDPLRPERFFAAVADVGIFLTDDLGETWSNISQLDTDPIGIEFLINTAIVRDAAGNPVMNAQGQILVEVRPRANNNTEMSVNSEGRLFVAVLEDGQPEYIGYADVNAAGAAAWTQMDLPFTDEPGGTVVGLNPSRKPGSQGAIHSSLVADPNDPDTVYVGGDTQEGIGIDRNGNSVGAKDFTGRLFRGDATQNRTGMPLATVTFSPQWEHLTHSNLIALIPEGGTATGSAPHADSRDMAVDANGDLIEVDDGGIYRRTSPLDNTGDWFSINGNLQVTEIHDIAYDSNSNILVAGSQDNGTIHQTSTGADDWISVNILGSAAQDPLGQPARVNADGGDVAVDDTSQSGLSIRYSSNQYLNLFRKQTFDAQNNLVMQEFITPPDMFAPFTTTVELNRIDPTRFAIITEMSVWESLDAGLTFNPVFGVGTPSSFFGEEPIVYGGMQDGVALLDVMYVGSQDEVFVRRPGAIDLELTASQFPGRNIRDLEVDPANWMTVYAMDDANIYRNITGGSASVGGTWVNISGNLGSLDVGELYSLQYIQGETRDAVILGTQRGIYYSTTDAMGVWRELATGLPNAPVYDLDYDVSDDVLVAGTLGRGAWLLHAASTGIAEPAEPLLAANTINGVVFNDLNRNRTRETSEPGVTGWRVYVDANANGRFDTGELSTTTDLGGRYTLPQLFRGRYRIGVEIIDDWEQTKPAAGATIRATIVDGAATEDVDFGVSLTTTVIDGGGDSDGGTDGGTDGGGGTDPVVIPTDAFVSGRVFDDINSNGVQDDGEAGVAGMLVYVDQNNSCVIGGGEPAAETNSLGDYVIDGLTAGEHTVRLVPHPGRVIPLPCNGGMIRVDSVGNMFDENGMSSDGIHFATQARSSIGSGSRDEAPRLDLPDHGYVPGFLLGEDLSNDGIAFISGIHPGQTELLAVDVQQLSVSKGYFWAWIDFDGDGEYTDSERVFSGLRLENGQNSLNFHVPSDAITGDTTARFRFAFESQLDPDAPAYGGEIEEYNVGIPMDGATGIGAEADIALVDEDSQDNEIDVLFNDSTGPFGGTLTVVDVSDTTAGGTVRIAADGGSVFYTPPMDFFGNDEFTYSVSDGLGGVEEAVVSVSVENVNDPPVAVDDLVTAGQRETGVMLNVLTNDLTAPDGLEVLAIVGVSPTANGGTVTIASDSQSVLYTAPPEFIGTDTFTYTISDGGGLRDTALVTVDVFEQDPLMEISLVVVDQFGLPADVVNAGDTFFVDVLVEDVSETPAGVFSAFTDISFLPTLVSPNGVIVYNDFYAVNRSGDFNSLALVNEAGASAQSLTPLGENPSMLMRIPFRADNVGTAFFTSSAADILPLHESSIYFRDEAVGPGLIRYGNTSVEIAVFGAQDDAATVVENTTDNPIDVLANDLRLSPTDTLTITGVGMASQGGTVSVNNDGSRVLYTPQVNFTGVDTFSYTVRDSNGNETDGMVAVTVVPEPEVLRARDDQFTVLEDSASVALDLVANDELGEAGGSFNVVAISNISSGGTVTIDPVGGIVRYTPVPDFFGMETFDYLLQDRQGGEATATATVTVTPVSDLPNAGDDAFEVGAGTSNNSLDVLANDDIGPDEGEVLSVVAIGDSAAGATILLNQDGTLSYTPPQDFLGTDTFVYTIFDGTDTAQANVSVQVAALPALVDVRLEVANLDGNPIKSLNVRDTFLLRGYVNDLRTDPTGVFSAYLDVSYPESIVEITGEIAFNNLVYDNLQSGDTSEPGKIDEIGATDGIDPLGPGEVLMFTVPFRATQVGTASFVGEPADILPLHQTSVYNRSEPVDETRIRFNATTLIVSGNGAQDDFVGVIEDSMDNVLDVLTNDIVREGEGPLNIIDVDTPSDGGTISISAESDSLIYTPAPDFRDVETVTYVVQNGVGVVTQALVTISVTNTNDPPNANDDSYLIVQGSSNNSLNVLDNDDSFPDPPEAISITNVGTPSQGGTAIIAGNGQSLVYTPSEGFLGDEFVAYTVTDENGGSATAQVTIRVLAELPTPVANYPMEFTDVDGNPITDIGINQDFQLRVYTQDIRPAPTGVFSGYLDVLYTGAEINGAITYGSDYPSVQKGDTAVAGLIDELGAVDGITRFDSGEPKLLAIVPFTATNVGTVTAMGNAADIPVNQTLLFGESAVVPPDQIMYTSVDINVTATVAFAPVLQNAQNPFDVNNDKQVSPLDALLIVNDMEENGGRAVDSQPALAQIAGGSEIFWIDVSGDNIISPLDALLVVNELDRLNQATTAQAAPVAPLSNGLPALNTTVVDLALQEESTGKSHQIPSAYDRLDKHTETAKTASPARTPQHFHSALTHVPRATLRGEAKLSMQSGEPRHPLHQTINDLAEDVQAAWHDANNSA